MGSVTRIGGETTVIDSETQEQTVTVNPILTNIINNNVVNIVQNTTVIGSSPNVAALEQEVAAHKQNKNNPHVTTKEQVGVNFQSGTISMFGSKKSIVSFSFPFSKNPRVSITLLDSSLAPAYTTAISKTGFQINMQTPYSGEIEWIALQRE